MVKIELTNNNGYAWTRYNNIYCKGYAFVENKPCENDDLAKQFDGLTKEEVLKLAKSLEGFFSVVIKYDDAVLALVDHVRSFPLFYYKSGDKLILCDSLDEERIKTFKVNKGAVKQYESGVYLLWDQTLFEGVYGIETGAYLYIKQDGETEYDFYYSFKYDDAQVDDQEGVVKRMHKVYEASFKRLIAYLNGRTAIIPLSGGHDSRLVAYYLTKLGYKNIIAFSYGDPKMSDSQISKQVAEALGIKYYYIPYNRSELRKAYKKYFKQYMVYAANGVSVPGLQTWYATLWLHKNKIVDEKCVFCPGYGGVLPGHYVHSSYVEQEYISKQTLLKQLEEEYFPRLFRFDQEYYSEFSKVFGNKSDIAELPEKVSGKKAAEIFERWIYREDQAKGIQNATRMFELYGAKWATPFFEKSQFEFWAGIDNSLRYKNKAFKAMEQELFEGPIVDVPFTGSKETNHTPKVKNFIQKILTLFDICLRPRKHHYMNVIVPLPAHWYNTLIKRVLSPSFYILSEYVKYLKRSSKNK